MAMRKICRLKTGSDLLSLAYTEIKNVKSLLRLIVFSNIRPNNCHTLLTIPHIIDIMKSTDNGNIFMGDFL